MSVINGRMPINSPIRELQEQDAVKYFKDYMDFCEKDGMEIPSKEPYNLAIAALEEVQQYREFGTVRQVEDFIADWRKYRGLGNFEELREAMEKQRAKKPVEDRCAEHIHYKCKCGYIFRTEYADGLRAGCIYRYCPDCGQAIVS